MDAAALVSLVADAAALVALRERRNRDAALAAGIAAGLSSAGLALLPVVAGALIARRRFGRVLPWFATALVAASAAAGWSWGTDASLAAALPAGCDLPLLVAACGIAAWLAASCAARPPAPAELDRAALLACATLPLLAPVGGEAAWLSFALLLAGAAPTFAPIAQAANDEPLPLRPRAI